MFSKNSWAKSERTKPQEINWFERFWHINNASFRNGNLKSPKN